MATALATATTIVAATAGCHDRMGGRGLADRIRGRPPTPDVAPVMLNQEPPFRYPSALWAQRVQGNVTLRVYVDSLGRTAPDSTAISTSSGIAALDSAALAGAGNLRFRPALLRGTPVSTALLVPVYFRHPAAPPLPGDSTIRRNPHVPQ
jgi:TonB family protein